MATTGLEALSAMLDEIESYEDLPSLSCAEVVQLAEKWAGDVRFRQFVVCWDRLDTNTRRVIESILNPKDSNRLKC